MLVLPTWAVPAFALVFVAAVGHLYFNSRR